jgi:hypothetical protein
MSDHEITSAQRKKTQLIPVIACPAPDGPRQESRTSTSTITVYNSSYDILIIGVDNSIKITPKRI